MSKISKRSKELKSMGNHQNFLKRIQKTLYYGKLPTTDCLSLPVTELASELFSEPRTGRSLDRLHCKDAAYISRQACVSPCSFVLAVLYLERLKSCNPDYLQCVAPSELFLVSLMVSSKFLHDYGDENEVFLDEWAASGGLSMKELIDLEKEFLNAIQWEIFVNEHTFWKKLAAIESSIGKKQGTARGFFTYTELTNLLTAIDIHLLTQYISAIFSILMTTYTAGIITILSSMFIVSNIPGNCLQPAQTKISNESHPTQIFFDTVNETELSEEPVYKKPLDAVDVLKTGIILASIKSSNYSMDEDENIESVSWDWWNSTTMDWLTETSRVLEGYDLIPDFKKYTYYRFIDMTIAGSKKLALEDQLHKGTKIRIQDQLEQSWHKEWTDSVSTLLSYPLSYFQQVKL